MLFAVDPWIVAIAADAEVPGVGIHKVTAWAFQTEGPIRGTPAVVDGAVYVGSADGCVYALDRAGGALRWTFQTGGAIAGTPAVADGMVIVAGRSDHVHALDARTGELRWSHRMGPDVSEPLEWDYFTASPVVAGDRVLVGSGDGHLYALSLADGTVRWKFRTGDRIRATPLVVGDTVYQPSGDDYLYALALADGRELWRFATAGTTLDRSQGFIRSDIFTRPSLSRGILVFGSRDANVYGVDVATHEKAWTFAYDTTWAMSTLAVDDTVYVGWSTNNKISAHDIATGELKWDFTSGAHNYGSALVDDDVLVRGSADGRIYGFDAATGAVRWSYEVGVEVFSGLVRDGDALIFGADDGRVRALIDAPPADKRVYLPEVPDGIRGFIVDAGLASHLIARGFETIASRQALAEFIEARAADGAPSVIVFAFAQVPPAVIGDDPSSGPLRRYLERGGKVVWPWGAPNLHLFDEAGNYVRHDPTLGQRLLEVAYLNPEDSGNYASRATPLGRNWGLPPWLKTSFASIPADAGVQALATDEYGRTSAWVKPFHARPGTGWVQVRPSSFGVPMTPADLALVEQIATYGLE